MHKLRKPLLSAYDDDTVQLQPSLSTSQATTMDADTRNRLNSNVNALKKINRILKQSNNRIGRDRDFVSFRQQLHADINQGSEIVQWLIQKINEPKKSKYDPSDEKLLTQSRQWIDQFNSLSELVTDKMNSNDPKPDANANAQTQQNNGGNPFDNNDSNNIQMQAQQQQNKPADLAQLGLISLNADNAAREDRLEQMQQIEEDVTNLNEAFTDLHDMVEEQGKVITVVVDNVEQARDDVVSGREHLEVAEKHQKSARKKQIMIFCCCLCILGLLFGLLGGFGAFNPKKK